MKNSFIFDVGRVLANFDFDRAIARLEHYSPYDREEIEERIFRRVDGKDIMDDYELGKISSLEYYQDIKERIKLNLDYKNFVMIWSDIFTENEKISYFLQSISGHPKVIVSNIDPMHWEMVSKYLNIRRFFQRNQCILSYEVGLLKPDIRIFKMARDLLPADNEIIYFDDSEDYVKIASKIGIKGIKYNCRVDNLEKILKEHHLLDQI